MRLLLVLACSTMLHAQAGPPASRPASRPALTVDHGLFDRILRENVRNERVDYLVIRRDRLEELDAYLASMDRIHPEGLGRDERLAFFINLYNASMIRAVIERLRAGWTPRAHGFQVFKDPVVRLEGGRISLNHLEHQIIRKRFHEPRVHAALVCGAVSCPPLLQRACTGAALEQDLEARMRAFVRDPRRNRIDRRSGRALLSRIFDWYADDFGGRGGILAYVDRYHPEKVTGLEVTFLDYSWELNIARPAAGRFVRVVRRTRVPGEAELVFEKGLLLAVEERRGDRVSVRVPGSRGRSVTLPAGNVASYP